MKSLSTIPIQVEPVRARTLALFTTLVAIFWVLNPAQAQTCDPPPSGIVSLWSGEGNAQDNFNTNNGILVGSPAFGPGEVSLAFNFSGVSQFVRVPDSPTLHFSNAMTVEAWVNPTAYVSNSCAVLSKYGANLVSGQCSWELMVSPTGLAYVAASTDGTVAAATAFATSPCPLNTWTHLAATYDGTNLSIYFNGVLQTASPMSGSIFAGSYDMGIGAAVGGVSNNAAGGLFAGLIDEAAVYSRALSATEIQAIYAAGAAGKCQTVPSAIFTQPVDSTTSIGQNASLSVGVSGSQPPTCQWYFNGTNISGATSTTLVITNVQSSQQGAYYVVVQNGAGGPITSSNALLTVLSGTGCFPLPSGIVSWWSGEGNGLDNFGVNNGVLVNSPSFAPGKVGLAFQFNGGNFVHIQNSASLTFSNAMTAEAWIYPTAYKSVSFTSILSTYASSGDLQASTYCLYVNGDGRGAMFLVTGRWTYTTVFTTNVCPLNTWTHLAATYDGSALKIYFNGALQSSTPTSGNINDLDGGNDVGIGASIGGGPDVFAAEIFSGMIDEPALYNRALAAAEIQGLSDPLSTGKCPIPPAIVLQPENASADVGQSSGFTVSATGTQPLSYQWYFNGNGIDGATNPSIAFNNVQTNQAGNYYITVSGPGGTPVVSSNVSLTIIAQPPCTPPPASVVSWWSGESNCFDNLNLNNGTDVNGVTFAPGRLGDAFQFTGPGEAQYVRIPDSPSLRFSTAMTVEAWVYPTAYYNSQYVSHFDTIISKFDNGPGNWQSSWHLFINTDGRGGFQATTNGGISATTIYTTGVCPLNTWTHLAATYDGTNVQIYFNGSLQNFASMPGSLFQGNDPVGIGAVIGGVPNNGDPAGPFMGLIDEPKVYNATLSASDISAIYTSMIYANGTCAIPPSILNQPSSVTVSNGGAAPFTVGAVGGQPLHYQWYQSGSSIAGATASSFTLTNAQPSQSGKYSVTVSNTSQVLLSSTAVLTVVGGSVTPPTLTAAVSGNQLLFTFPTVLNQNCTIEYKTNLTSGSWIPLTNFIASGTNSSATDSVTNSTTRFYRVSASDN